MEHQCGEGAPVPVSGGRLAQGARREREGGREVRG
jgi:hypothetical protein